MQNQRKKLLFLVLAISLLLVTSAIATPGAGQKLQNFWLSWFGSELPVDGTNPPVQPPGNDKPDPLPQPKPIPEPIPEPQPEPKPIPQPPVSNPGGDEPNDPIIFVGQQLLVPVSGNVQPDSSKVINQGISSGSKKQIALTFDAGWLFDQTIPLLDVLDQYNVKSTFFLRALWVKANPELAREIVKRGHIIENHSLTHGHMKEMTDQQIRNELIEATRIINVTTGSNPYLFRPPFGEYDNRMLKILAELGYPYTVMWTVDTHDWAEEIRGQKVTADYLVNRILSNASDNGVILMHVGGYKTVEALPRIITGLQEKGYQLVTVNEMLPTPSQSSVAHHTVIQGETLYSISRKYGVTVQQLILANGL